MSEALTQLFSGNQAADLAFWIIVGISFLLGMLLFALLAYWPNKRKLEKKLEHLKKENELLHKDYKDLSTRFSTMSTQYQHVQEELQITATTLKEQEGIVGRQLREIKYLKEELAKQKAQTKNYQKAKDKLLEQYQSVAKTNEANERKLEVLKRLMDEAEQERRQLQANYQNNQSTDAAQKQQLEQLIQEQKRWKTQKQALEQDLTAALEQRSELKQLLQRSEDRQELEGSTEEELKTQVVDLKAYLKSLEDKNTELLQRLAPYLATERAEEKEAEAVEPLLVDLFIEAEENLKTDGFFTAYATDELVENPEYLAKALSELEDWTAKPIGAETEECSIEQEEEDLLREKLQQARLAMERKGFYEDMEEAVLLSPSDDEQTQDDDELLQERLKETALTVQDSLFYNGEELDQSLIEEQGILEVELAKLEQSKATEAPITAFELSEEEQQQLEEANQVAQNALEQPGLYAPIDAATLWSGKNNELEEQKNTPQQEQRTQAVVQEVGRRIPRASFAERDALQEIDGIGEFMEYQLNQLGIYTYEQISFFDEEFIDLLSLALDFPAAVIHQKKWVEQAQNKLTQS